MAVEDARGQWIVVDGETRLEPLRDPDPYIRMMACHLAASATTLEAFVRSVLPRLESTGWADHDHRYRHLLDFGWAAQAYTRPVGTTFARVIPVRGILELPFSPLTGEDDAA